MEFKYAHLADYAGDGGRGKVTIVGIFDTVFVNEQRPILLPPMSLAASFEAHVTEGTEHQLEVRFCDEDGHDMIPRGQLPLRFAAAGPDRPLRANAFISLAPIRVADVGDYAFHLFVDGLEVESIRLHVVPMPPMATA